ncbi:MAG: hypothetical protein H7A32_03595 [Deltaproteobacteria bacterium]|nr:hypothetical protein [Deltaproteobacteria bacterium]
MKLKLNQKNMLSGLSIALLIFFVQGTLQARGDYKQFTEKKDKLTYVVDGMFQISKATDEWDTQDSHQDNSPVKWVLHVSGDNPEVRLRYDFNPKGSDAFKYGVHVKDMLKSRGINVERVYYRNINGRKASIIKGIDRDREKRWLIAVWRNKSRGFLLECSVEPGKFHKYREQFNEMINSVHILK